MFKSSQQLETIDAIRRHVGAVLAQRDRLDLSQAELWQGWMVKAGRRCGILFQVRGPRLMRTHAIWSADEQRILFYESTGARFAETLVIDGPELDSIATSSAESLRQAS